MLRRAVLGGIVAAAGATLLPRGALAAPVSRAGLGRGAYARMHALLEATFLSIDVLDIELHFDQKTADRLQGALRGKEHTPALERRAVDIAVDASDVYCGLEFIQEFSREDFIEGIRKDLGRALKAKLIDKSEHDRVSLSLPRWFAFLGDRGIKGGDRLYQRGSPKGLHSVFIDDAGKKRLDTMLEGAGATRTMIATYLAPGGDLREPLVRSLFPDSA